MISANPHPHRVVVAAFAPAQALDVTGPLEVFAMANQVSRLRGAAAPYELQLAAPRRGLLATTTGVPLFATRTLRGVRADTLLVAGGPGARALRDADTRAVRELRAACERAPRVGSVCTGAFALAATGLLEGCRVTTHWAHFDEFAAAYPAIEIERDALFVHGPRFHSAAGVTAGIDYALSLVEADLGRPVALQVAQALVVFLKRPGGQSQFSAELAAEAAAPEPQRFAPLLRWMHAHLTGDLSVPALAERAAMSPRNFARRFQEAMAATPARYVQRLRLDASRRLLTAGNLPLARIAQRCGFASEEAMRVAFRKQLNTTPGDFRARFRTSARGARAATRSLP